MSRERSTQSTTSTATATPEERELNKLQLEQAKEFDPIQRELNDVFGNLILQLGRGEADLPGVLGGVTGGIEAGQIGETPQIDASKYLIDDALTRELTQKAIQDIQPTFQQGGILDSGVNVAASARTAGDIRRAVAERNLDTSLAIRESNIERDLSRQQFDIGQRTSAQGFNVGNLLNLLNLAVGGQASIQQPQIQQQQGLGSRLAGLRTTNSNTTVTQMNPFLKSFQTSLGKGLGSGFSKGAFGLGSGGGGGGGGGFGYTPPGSGGTVYRY